MIQYDNRNVREIFFRTAGSVLFRWSTVIPPLLSTLLCTVGLTVHTKISPYLFISSSVFKIYAGVIGFVIVTRTNLAFGRYFEGVTAVQELFSKWRDAFASLLSFIEPSIDEHVRKGDVEAVSALVDCRARFLHWFSLLSAVAVVSLQEDFAQNSPSDGGDLEILDACSRTSSNRMSNPGLNEFSNESSPANLASADTGGTLSPCMSDSNASLAPGSKSPITPRSAGSAREFQSRVEGDTSMGNLSAPCDSKSLDRLQIIGEVTKEEKRILGRTSDKVLTVTKWILMDMSEQSINKRILIAPPILSRVYQELSNGMHAYAMALKIADVPFPFPFAQALQFALYWFFLFCPVAILEDLKELPVWPGFSRGWSSIILNFVTCVGYCALNEIAMELEDPFGDDANDFPVHVQQWQIVNCIEDSFFQQMPRDFGENQFGKEKGFFAKEAQNIVARLQTGSAPAPPPAPAPAPAPAPPPAVSSAPVTLQCSDENYFKELDKLRSAVASASEAMRNCTEDIGSSVSSMDTKLKDVLNILLARF